MPMVEFEIIVGVSSERAFSEELAIAEASRYLAYSDQTDTFGHRASIFQVNTYDGPSSGADADASGKPEAASELDWGIGLHFDAPITSDDQLKSFMDELASLAHVESVEITGQLGNLLTDA
jgi:hypothetical protein